jgi:hypothetical protein
LKFSILELSSKQGVSKGLDSKHFGLCDSRINVLLISRLYRELKKLSPQRINTPVKKLAHELNREFSKEEIQMNSKCMKKCSTSLVIKEMQIKTPLRFHLTPVRMARIKGNNNNKCWQGYAEIGTFIHCWWEWGMQISTTTMESIMENPQKTRDRTAI